jgi:hypothetical protein
MLGVYGRALGSKRDMMAQRMPNGSRDDGCTPPPPGPAHSHARWGWSEGATFEYYAFLRRAHPQWLAADGATWFEQGEDDEIRFFRMCSFV